MSSGHVARLVVGNNKQDKEEEVSEKLGGKVERSNSRMNKVSNLIKWPKTKEKTEKSSAAHLYVSDTSQV